MTKQIQVDSHQLPITAGYDHVGKLEAVTSVSRKDNYAFLQGIFFFYFCVWHESKRREQWSRLNPVKKDWRSKNTSKNTGESEECSILHHPLPISSTSVSSGALPLLTIQTESMWSAEPARWCWPMEAMQVGVARCVKGPGWDAPVQMGCGYFIMLVNDMQSNANKHVGGTSRSISCGVVCSNRNASVFQSERLRRRSHVYLAELVYSVFTKCWQMQPMFASGEAALNKPGTGLSVKAFYPPSPL